MYRKISGYEIQTLLDLQGKFYLIHPFENNFKRNIFNNIIDKLDKLPIKIYTNLLFNLKYKKLLIFDNINELNIYYKTELVKIASRLKMSVKWNDIGTEDILSMIASINYGSFDKIFELLILMKMITDIKSFISNVDVDNEIEFIFNTINNLKNKFPILFEKKTYNYYYNKNKDIAEAIINNFIKEYKKTILDPSNKNYNIASWNKFTQLYVNNELKIEKIIDIIIEEEEIKKLSSFKLDIFNYCTLNNINFENIITFIDKYIKLIKTNFELNILSNNESDFSKIILSLMHGYVYNTGYRINTQDKNHRNLLVNEKEMYLLNKTKENKSNTIFYYNKNYGEEIYEIGLTNKIKIEYLVDTNPLYFNNNNFNKNIIMKDNKYISGDLFDELCVKICNYKNIKNIYENVEYPILNDYIKKIKN
jgi:hypothetical protein